MLYFHVTAARRVPSICKHGLFSRRRWATLVGGNPPVKDLREHLDFYRHNPLCKHRRNPCAVVVFDIPDTEADQFVYQLRGRRGPVYRGEALFARYYQSLRQPLPPRFVKGHAPLSTRSDVLARGTRLQPCPKQPRIYRRYVVGGKLTHVPRFGRI